VSQLTCNPPKLCHTGTNQHDSEIKPRPHNPVAVRECNGHNALISNNAKLEKVMEIIDEMEVDVFTFNEHKLTVNIRITIGQDSGSFSTAVKP